MDITKIKTLGELKKAGYKRKSVKEEIRENLIKKLNNKETTFPGIIGYEDSVIPDTERALLSRHNILFLGLRGQAKTRMAIKNLGRQNAIANQCLRTVPVTQH